MNINNSDDATIGILIEIIQEVIPATTDRQPLSIDDRLTDLGASSLDLLQIISEIEKKFAIEVPDEMLSIENLQSIHTLSRTIAVIKKS